MNGGPSGICYISNMLHTDKISRLINFGVYFDFMLINANGKILSLMPEKDAKFA